MDTIKNRPAPARHCPGGMVAEVSLPEPNLIAKMSPWSMNFRQLEPGPMQTSIRVREGRIVSLLEISMNRGIHQQGAVPPGTLSFGVPMSRNSVRWQGMKVQEGSFLTFGGNSGFEGISDRDFHGVTFSVADTAIEALADRMGLPLDNTVRSSGVLRPPSDGVDLSALVRKTALRFLNPSRLEGMDPCAEEEMLANFLYAAASEHDLEDRSPGHQRARAVRIALEFMERYTEENVPISRICEASGVSVRTLNRAFRDKFGIGPKAYFLRMRLGLLRRSLIESDGSGLVTDMANQLGFWHMGQLARDYRAQFGELPSQTSRNA